MGFIKTNYKVEDMGITLPNAYAQIIRLSADREGRVSSVFAIQQTREDIANKDNIDTISYRCEIDKDLPIYRQVYEKAKIDIFTDWEDDIVEE